MKRHERCSISGSRANLGAAPVKYHYFYRFFTYSSLNGDWGRFVGPLVSGVKAGRAAASRRSVWCARVCAWRTGGAKVVGWLAGLGRDPVLKTGQGGEVWNLGPVPSWSKRGKTAKVSLKGELKAEGPGKPSLGSRKGAKSSIWIWNFPGTN